MIAKVFECWKIANSENNMANSELNNEGLCFLTT